MPTSVEDNFEIRLGRIRAPSGSRQATSALRRLRGVARRGAKIPRSVRRGSRSSAGLRTFSRRVVVKMHLQRMAGRGAAVQALHLRYIERDGTERPQGRENEGRLFDAKTDDASREAFEARGKNDRHQFRMIVSPEDGRELQSLRATTRDLMRDMERDLGTKLDWVASDHWDTDHPHVHVVIGGRRDDGRDLVIPREYISRGIRDRARELVERELGPVPEHDFRKRHARMLEQESYTALDREIERLADNTGCIDDQAIEKRVKAWRRPLVRLRLRHLRKLGLASRRDDGWHMPRDTPQTLRRLGERGDKLKALHRTLRERGTDHRIDGVSVAGLRHGEASFVGRVADRGIAADGRDRAFLLVEDIAGRLCHVPIGRVEKLDDLTVGDIVRVSPMDTRAKQVDRTVEAIAGDNGGAYDEEAHVRYEPGVQARFVRAHVRRLEALRRQGLVERTKEGLWQIPENWAERVEQHQRRITPDNPTVSTVTSTGLRTVARYDGLTWIDDVRAEEVGHGGFAREVRSAKQARTSWLREQGYLDDRATTLESKSRDRLARRGLHNVAAAVSAQAGKPYRPAVLGRPVAGRLIARVDTPAGPMAHLERSRDFTLVPWRAGMERQISRELSARIGSTSFDWSVSRARAIGKSL